MSFSTRKSVQHVQQDRAIVEGPQEELNPQELEYLLNVLKNVDLKGHQVEMFYNLVIKIQSQYVKKTKQ